MHENQFEQLLQKLQLAIASIAGLTTLLSISGYMIFHAHLSRYTDIPVTGIPIIYYWIAGLTLAIIASAFIVLIWIALKLGSLIDWTERSIKDPQKLPERLRKIAMPLFIGLISLYLIWVGFLL